MSAARAARVLVVDDEPGMRETLVDILEGVGYEVSEASDGQRAVSQVRNQPVDVVVMDVQMPNCDGVQALQQMRTPPPAVIMMTAYALEERLRAAVDANAFAILHKPFSVGRLLKLIESAAAPS